MAELTPEQVANIRRWWEPDSGRQGLAYQDWRDVLALCDTVYAVRADRDAANAAIDAAHSALDVAAEDARLRIVGADEASVDERVEALFVRLVTERDEAQMEYADALRELETLRGVARRSAGFWHPYQSAADPERYYWMREDPTSCCIVTEDMSPGEVRAVFGCPAPEAVDVPAPEVLRSIVRRVRDRWVPELWPDDPESAKWVRADPGDARTEPMTEAEVRVLYGTLYTDLGE